jgi:hypothetical protein
MMALGEFHLGHGVYKKKAPLGFGDVEMLIMFLHSTHF